MYQQLIIELNQEIQMQMIQIVSDHEIVLLVVFEIGIDEDSGFFINLLSYFILNHC